MCGPFKKWAWNPISSLDPLICERHQLYFIFCICPTKYCNKLCAYFMNFMKTLYEYNIFYLNSFFFFFALVTALSPVSVPPTTVSSPGVRSCGLLCSCQGQTGLLCLQQCKLALGCRQHFLLLLIPNIPQCKPCTE